MSNNITDKSSHFKLSLLAIIVIIAIIATVNSFFGSVVKVSPTYNNTTDERIAAIGKVYMEGDIDITAVAAAPAPTAKARSGKEIYDTTCGTCHAIGVAGAPKYGNKGDWSSRVAQGLEGLITVAIKGKGAMPPRGTCGNCSDDEIAETVKYMLDSVQ